MTIDPKHNHYYVIGQWRAYNEVLNLINTFEEKEIKKKDFYHLIFELRPQSLEFPKNK